MFGRREIRLHLIAPTVLCVVTGLVMGCGTPKPGVIHDVAIQSASNPLSGTALRFDRVTDLRHFGDRHTSNAKPSLWVGSPEDHDLTSRAVARNVVGHSLGDVLLPQDVTVQSLVTTELARALRENGYRVVAEGDPAFKHALPVEVEILRFWTWDHRAWVDTYHFHAAVKVTAPFDPFRGGQVIESETRKVGVMRGPALRGVWHDMLAIGLDRFSEEARTEIENAKLTGDFGRAPDSGSTKP